MTRVMGLDPGYSVGLVVREDDRPLWAAVLRCPPPSTGVDDHPAVAARLAGLLDQLCGIYQRWAPAQPIVVACEAFNTPQSWQQTAKGRRKLGKVEIEQHLWPRLQWAAICARFCPTIAVPPGTHEGQDLPFELTPDGWELSGWANADPQGDLRDVHSAWRVSLAANRARIRKAAA